MSAIQATTFSALADPTRLSIVELLAKFGELSASEIYGRFDSTASAVSQHLKVLHKARLVVVNKRAQQRIYQLDAATMAEVEAWASKRTREWHARLDTLEAYVKEVNQSKEGTSER